MDAWSDPRPPRRRRSWVAAGVGALMVALAVGAAAAQGGAGTAVQTVGATAQPAPPAGEGDDAVAGDQADDDQADDDQKAEKKADKGQKGRGKGPKARPPAAPEADPTVAAGRGDEQVERSRRRRVEAPPEHKAAPQNAAPIPEDLAPDPVPALQHGEHGHG